MVGKRRLSQASPVNLWPYLVLDALRDDVEVVLESVWLLQVVILRDAAAGDDSAGVAHTREHSIQHGPAHVVLRWSTVVQTHI